MKKLYSLLAVLVAATSVSAQSLYFKGAGEGLSWDEGVDLAVTLADGNYTVTINSLSEFKVSSVSSADGGWDAFNGGALYAAGLEDKANLGKPLAAVVDGGPNNAVPWQGDYTIVIPADLSTITITTTTPEPVGFLNAYLRGGMNNWLNDADDATKALWQMSTEDGVKYWFDCTGATIIPANTEFKIADANWSAINYTAGDEIVPFDEPVQWNYNNSANGLMLEEYEGTILLDLVNGPRKDAMVTVYTTLVPHGTGVEAIEADTNAAPVFYNLQGVQIDKPSAGVYLVRRGAKVSKVLVK